MPKLNKQLTAKAFQQLVWDYYLQHGRHLPWRTHPTPYKVLVSEIMLQQTQVDRVIPFFNRFIKTFPNFKALGDASLSEVLNTWQGLGYNRRAKFLQQAAQKIVTDHQGKLPSDPAMLETLPGVGPATARSIATFAYNRPEIFIETNIRAVFIYHFFPKKEKVTDTKIYSLIQKTFPPYPPRDWYAALMDYGTYLKKHVVNPSRQSKHYTRQSTFKNSIRQKRGQILKALLQAHKPLTLKDLSKALTYSSSDLSQPLAGLLTDGLVRKKGGCYTIAH